MRASGRVVVVMLWLVVVAACSAANPADSTPPTAEPDDPAEALAGRAVEAIATGGIDVVMRIGADGFRLPEDEVLLDVHGDRVLSGRANPEGDVARLILRDLVGNKLREISTGMQIPQTAIVRGDDVYFGGVDARDDDAGLVVTDRGGWVAHGDAPPVPIVAASAETVIYHVIERSPDGRAVGISRCGYEACTTILIGPEGDVVEIPKAGLIALTNEVALLIGRFSDVTAYAVADGTELWHAKTDGVYYERYATTDGARIVISSVEDAGDADGNSTDQLRLEVMDALTGAVERTVLVSTEHALSWVAPTLSSDRYVAILDTVLPKPDEGSRTVRVVDLEAGRLLDVELALGDVP